MRRRVKEAQKEKEARLAEDQARREWEEKQKHDEKIANELGIPYEKPKRIITREEFNRLVKVGIANDWEEHLYEFVENSA